MADKIRVPKGVSSGRASRPYFARAVGRCFDARAADEITELDIYDEIGFWGVTAADFRKQLKAITSPNISVRLNSPGGDVFDGIAMHNDLVAHPANITIEISGLAASAASIIAMAGDEIRIAENAFLMIHNSWAVTIGDQHAHNHAAELLGEIDGALVRTYAARTGLDPVALGEMLDAETWLGAEDAVEQNFADEVISAADVSARFDLSGFKNVPKALPKLGRKTEAPATPRDLERALRDAGFSGSARKAIVSRAFPNFTSLRDAGDDDKAWAALHGLAETLKRGLNT